MEQTPKKSSKKAPLAIAIIGLVAVGGYFGGKYYISHKTMEYLHEQVSKLDKEDGGRPHYAIKDENRGLFTSTTTLVISADSTNSITIPLTIHHGFSSTDINSDDIRFQLQGQNGLQVAGGNAEKAQFALHMKNSDLLSKRGEFKDSFIELSVPGKLAEAEKIGQSFTNIKVRLERNAEGKLTASGHADDIDILSRPGKRITTGPLNFSVAYDSQWTTNLLEAGYNLHDDDSHDSRVKVQALEKTFASALPDVHIDVKNLDSQYATPLGFHNLLIGDITFDINRDDKAKVTRLVTSEKGVGIIGLNDQKTDLDLKLALDQSVVDTALSSLVNRDSDNMEKTLAVAKTSPRLVLEDLNIKNDDVHISASGEAHINGNIVKSANDLNPSAFVANFTVTGMPDPLKYFVEQYYDINSIKSGEPVVLKAENGRVMINNQYVPDRF